MYLVVIAWMYVVLMMAVAEATSANGTVLGAIVTFFLYGLMPLALVVYLMGTPQRRRRIKAREAEEHAAAVDRGVVLDELPRLQAVLGGYRLVPERLYGAFEQEPPGGGVAGAQDAHGGRSYPGCWAAARRRAPARCVPSGR